MNHSRRNHPHPSSYCPLSGVRNTSLMLVVALVLAVFMPLAHTDAKKGGNGNGGGGTSPPATNVRYRVDLIPTPESADVRVYTINSFGMVVGSYEIEGSGDSSAIVYDSMNDQLYDFNQLPSLSAQLTALLGTADWYFAAALGINNRGDIVGRAKNAFTGEENGFVIDTSPVDEDGFQADPAVWAVALLPDFDAGVNNWYSETGKHINEVGDVVGTYVIDGEQYAYLFNPWLSFIEGTNPIVLEPTVMGYFPVTALNNLGQVALLSRDENGDGIVYLFDPADSSYTSFAEVPYTWLGGLNDDSVFCGNFSTSHFGIEACRHNAVLLDAITDGTATDINSDGDVLIEKQRQMGAWATAYLLYTGSSELTGEQQVNIHDLVVEGDALSLWFDNRYFVRTLSDRDPTTGFSRIAGTIRDSDAGVERGVVLAPFVP